MKFKKLEKTKTVINKLKQNVVNQRVSLELKRLGFNEYCFAYYNVFSDLKLQAFPYAFWSKNDKIDWLAKIFLKKTHQRNMCTAPLYQQVVDWFLNTHNIFIEVQLTDNTNEYGFTYCIMNSKDRVQCSVNTTERATFEYSKDRLFHNVADAYENAFYKAMGSLRDMGYGDDYNWYA